MVDVGAARDETPGTANVVHLNNAGAALPTNETFQAVLHHLTREAAIGGYEAHAEAADQIAAAYDAVASLIGVDRSRVAMVESATAAWDRGLQAIAFSDPLRAGDRILVSSAEYASCVLPLIQLTQATGASIEFIPDGPDGTLDAAALDDMLDDRVRILAVVHAPSQNGLVNDVVAVGDALRRSGAPAWFFVDACQSIGQLDVDMDLIGCDVLSATGRKWLRGPRGTGFLAVSQRMLDRVQPFPLDLHAATWTGDGTFAMEPDARRFESWEKSYAMTIGLGVAVRQAVDLGMPAIRERIDALATRTREGLSRIPGMTVRDRGEVLSGIVTASVDEPHRTAAALVRALSEQGINTSLSMPEYARRDFEAYGVTSVVRISPHYYNTEDEIDRLLDLVDGF